MILCVFGIHKWKQVKAPRGVYQEKCEHCPKTRHRIWTMAFGWSDWFDGGTLWKD